MADATFESQSPAAWDVGELDEHLFAARQAPPMCIEPFSGERGGIGSEEQLERRRVTKLIALRGRFGPPLLLAPRARSRSSW